MHIRIDRIYDRALATLAKLHGCYYRREGNVRDLITKMAEGELALMPLKIDSGMWIDLNTLETIADRIQDKQPFAIRYRDAARREIALNARYGEIAFHEKRFYLDVWCEETEENQDILELKHNWCLRIDRILAIENIDGYWKESGLDVAIASLRFYGGMAFAYEYRDSDIRVERFDDCVEIERKFSSSFWLLRSLLAYGADCEVIAPDSVRSAIAAKYEEAKKRY